MAEVFNLTEEAQFTPIFLQEVFTEQIFAEQVEDQHLINQLYQQSKGHSTASEITISNEPQPKGSSFIHAKGQTIYLRNPAVAERSLNKASYLCEIDTNHPSFVRRNENTLYMKPHHLIPMSMTDYFGVNLDREQNIFSLCSNCHNQIHYGIKEDVQRLVSKLFLSRKFEICSILGQLIRIEDMFRIYKVL